MVYKKKKTMCTQFIIVVLLYFHVRCILTQNYIHADSQVTWAAAESFCVFSYGRNLASIHSSSQYNMVKSVCVNSQCWIGLNRQTNFMWTDSSLFNFGNDTTGGVYPWTVGEPNDSSGIEDCVHLTGVDKTWNDNSCSVLKTILCNYPPPIIYVIKDNINNIRHLSAKNHIIATMNIMDEIIIRFNFMTDIYANYSNEFISLLHIGNSKCYTCIYIHTQTKILHIKFNNNTYTFNQTIITWSKLYFLELYLTQNKFLLQLNGSIIANNSKHSHLVINNQSIYVSDNNNNNSIYCNGYISNLEISTTNSYISSFNYLCDYNNRFSHVKGLWNWDPITCYLSQTDTSGEGNIVWIELPNDIIWTDYKIETKIYIQSGEEVGILLRCKSVSTTNNYGQFYAFSLQTKSNLFANKEVRMVKIDNGDWNKLAYHEMSIVTGRDYILRVEAIANEFKVYLDNELLFTHSDSSYMFGSIGLRTYKSSVIYKSLRIIFPNNNKLFTMYPTYIPTINPTINPTLFPTQSPTFQPSNTPTNNPIINTISPSIN
eukprot:335717_1